MKDIPVLYVAVKIHHINNHICTSKQLHGLPYEDLEDPCPSMLATTSIREVELAAASVQQSTYEPEVSMCRNFIRHYMYNYICLNVSYR